MSQVQSVVDQLLAGSDASVVAGLQPDQKALVVDALLKGVAAVPPTRASAILDLCVSLAGEAHATMMLYFSLIRRGMIHSNAAPEKAAEDLVAALALAPSLGLDLSGSFPASAPLTMVVSNLVWFEYSIGNGFQLKGMKEQAISHYKSAAGLLSHVMAEGKPGEEWYFERRGDVELVLRDFGPALEDYRRALSSQEAANPQKRMSLLRSVAQAATGSGDLAEAESAFKESVGLASQIGDGEAGAMAYLSLGNLYENSLNRFEDAVTSAEAATQIAVKSDTKMVALQLKATAYLSLGRYSDSLKCSMQVAHEYNGRGDLYELMALAMLASSLSSMGRHVEALTCYRKAVSIAEALGDDAQLSDLMCQSSTERLLMGEYGGAIEDLETAAKAALKTSDATRRARAEVLQGNCYLYNIHSLSDAQRCYNMALDEFATEAQKTNAGLYQYVQALTGLASTYASQGDRDGANTCLDDALEVCGSLEPMMTTKAEVYRSIADARSSANEKGAAEQSEREALEIYGRLGLQRERASTLRDLAYIFAEAGDIPAALEAVEAAEKVYAEGGFVDEALNTVNGKALILFTAGRLEEAKSTMEDGLLRFGVSESEPAIIATSYAGLAAIAKRTGDADGSLDNLLKASELLDSVRSRMSSGALRMSFQGGETGIYGAIVEAYHEKGEEDKSFEYVEKSKSRVLVEDLRTAMLRQPSTDSELLAEEKRFLDDLRASFASKNPARRKELEASLRETWKRMEATSPSREMAAYLAVRRGETIGAAQVEELLERAKETVIIEYYVLNKQLLIYVFARGHGLHVYSSGVGTATLSELSTRLLAALKDGSNNGYVEVAKEMSDYLLGPVRDVVAGYQYVHLIPHGILHTIPIHILPLAGRPLVETHRISYSQSASILGFLSDEDSERSGAIVVGDAESDLPFARVEAGRIAALLGTKPIIGSEATKDLVISSIEGKRNIAFSCHARFNADDPLSSCVKLQGSDVLTARDWLTLETPADLVTISACESAVSVQRPGDEMIGLVRAMTFAGARSVVASLWKVDDCATYLIMTRFYENLFERRLDKPSALQDAQLFVRSLKEIPSDVDPQLVQFVGGPAKDFSHPRYWAPFVLMGSLY